MKPEPFRIAPSFVPRLWGGRSLAPLYPEKTNLPEPVGEVWLTGVDCQVTTGPFRGKTLGEAWREIPPEWRGTRFATPDDFPILVKFIFPHAKLSIQVHPQDAYAARNEKSSGGRGKTEMWHALYAEPHAQVLLGLRPGVNKEKFLEALAGGDLEELFETHRVHRGDTFFVPAGIPHTIGPGMVLCEIQEYSDLTYRVYDYNRLDTRGQARELHIEKALETIAFGVPAPGPFPAKYPVEEKVLLVACRYFAVEKWHAAGQGTENTSPAQFELLTITEGGGVIHCEVGDYHCSPGETWFLPASLETYQFSSPGTALRAYVPDLDVLVRTLVDKGYSEQQCRRFIFV